MFGRCCVTGEWGKCIALDLGDMSIQTPDTERGVIQDIDTGKVTFTCWQPTIIHSQVTVSEDGLTKMLEFMKSQPNPIPPVNPELVYMWHVLYKDGTPLQQFSEEGETRYADINLANVTYFSVLPRVPGLPMYVFEKVTGKIYKDGIDLDLGYGGLYIPESTIFYGRAINHTWGSPEQVSLDREITNACTTVLQLLGWKVDGGPCCIIAIDARGNWRPYDYVP